MTVHDALMLYAIACEIAALLVIRRPA